MMRKYLLTAFLLLLAAPMVFAQNGRIRGKVLDAVTKQPISFANVRASKGGQLKGGAVADFDGNYDINPVTPGEYEVEASYVGYKPTRQTGVKVYAEATQFLDFALTEAVAVGPEVIVVAFKEKLIDPGAKGDRHVKTAGRPSRDLNSLIALEGGVTQSDDGAGISIRGNDPANNAYYVNGVRQFGNATLPPVESVEDLTVITGGIPAQYGDGLGGVISVTTKSAARKLSGSFQMESSRPFDEYNYDLVAGTISGPILKSNRANPDKPDEKMTLIGFFGALQYNGVRDSDPSAYGYHRPTDQAMEELAKNPVRSILGKYYSNANFWTMNQFQKQGYLLGGYGYSTQFNGNIDIQPYENTLITIGGNLNLNIGQQGTNFNFFNYALNPAGINNDYNMYVRFRQSLNNGSDSKSSPLKNVFYQVQADYSHTYAKYYDPNLKDDLSRYNYVGEFRVKKLDLTIPGAAGLTLNSLSRDSSRLIQQISLNNPNTVYVLRNQDFGLDFVSNKYSNANAVVNNAIKRDDPTNFLGFTQASIANGSLNNFLGAVVNGDNFNIGYSYAGNNAIGTGGFSSPGGNSGYGYTATDQYRLSAQAGADIGHHSIKVGFEFEQRVILAYNGATNLYTRGRALVNKHLYTGSEGSIVTMTPRGRGDTVDVYTDYAVRRDPTTNAVIGQTDFDRNLRASLGLPIDQLINIDAITPDKININQFSVSDIFAGATNPMAYWQGYNAYGVKNNKAVSFFDFFTDTLNRPTDAFRPIYVAGYIEDKFEIENLITLRLGLRVDRFDANTPVLKDRYSLTRLTTAGETDFTKFKDAPARPAGIGDNYAVYVNQSSLQYDNNNQGDYQVVGYRDGGRWFRADGTETQASEITKLGGGTAQPWFTKTFAAEDNLGRNLLNQNKLTFDAFTDFKPQINVLPRLSFSFPISDQAFFYAHYDILTQRPLAAGGGQNYASPVFYYALAQGSGSALFGGNYPYLPNANLKPQKKIDYEMGFQQALTNRSALKFSVFYQEIKDLIQIITVQSAYPSAYQTDGNQDFGISKGAVVEYDFRRIGGTGFGMNASYTLTFAEVSQSNLLGNLSSRIANATLRDVFPATYDQRHNMKFNFDYRVDKGPEIFGGFPLKNAGINFTNILGSGTPYSRLEDNYTNNTFSGLYNGERLPWQFRSNIRVDKNFYFNRSGGHKSTLNVYIYVQNLFNIQNTLGVYARTGSPKDDGYLTSAYGHLQMEGATINQSQVTYQMYYNLLLLNPEFISLPRRTRLGISYNF